MINKFTAAVALLALVVLAGCEQPVPQTPTKFSGTATRYFVAHQGGYLGEAVVTTDDNGNVTAATMNEWQGPSGWATFTAKKQPTDAANNTFSGGEIIRFKMTGKNSNTVITNGSGYAYFVYNGSAKVWYEFSLPTSTTNAYTAPTTTTTGKNWDALMALPTYAKAYAEAAKAVADGTDATAMQNVTIADAAAGAAPVLTVGANATSHYGHLNKSATTSTYMAVGASGLGYKNNNAALIKFFKSNPTANYLAAVTTSAAINKADTVYPESLTAYTAASDSVWTVADVVTGATYSDFISYATELQNAYIAAVAEVKTGNIRALK